ncbi:nucleotidyl transferase AbiEii/AbiGii toxin family protein [Paraburkholderia sp. EG286B]|uniref:nucleotidyl transferase AbiEii/AbiGii toxin family protein n=1 Tax=Paraburkholderia sp. EG286B TaxID=3237011 RepID=UPI0034D27DE1
MAAIFWDKFLSQHVAMRGGTVLHKAHLAPAVRYSEDIDLVLVTDRKEAAFRGGFFHCGLLAESAPGAFCTAACSALL